MTSETTKIKTKADIELDAAIRSGKNKGVRKILFFLFYSFVITPQLAYAQIGEDFLDNVVELLTEDWARAVAIIAIAIAGYMFMFTRQIEKSMFLKIAGGIFLIFGAATIVDEMEGWVD